MKLYEMDYNKRRIVNAYPVRSPYIVQRTSTHAWYKTGGLSERKHLLECVQGSVCFAASPFTVSPLNIL